MVVVAENPCAMAAILSQHPTERDRRPAWLFAVVEAVGVRAGFGRVQLQVRGASRSRPVLCGVQQSLSGALGAAARVHCQVLDPRAVAEADRVELVVDGDETGYGAVDVGDEDLGRVAVDRGTEARRGCGLVPHRGLRAWRREQPVVGRYNL